jgi:hypothetical protein
VPAANKNPKKRSKILIYKCPAAAEDLPGSLTLPSPASAPCRKNSVNRPKARPRLSIVCRRSVSCSN